MDECKPLVMGLPLGLADSFLTKRDDFLQPPMILNKGLNPAQQQSVQAGGA